MAGQKDFSDILILIGISQEAGWTRSGGGEDSVTDV